MYEPGLPDFDTDDPEGFRRYVIDELRSIAAAFTGLDNILLEELHAEPLKPRNGVVVLADGTDWNPGSGAGFYGRSGGAWVFLG